VAAQKYDDEKTSKTYFFLESHLLDLSLETEISHIDLYVHSSDDGCTR